jgi:hypothetical protein
MGFSSERLDENEFGTVSEMLDACGCEMMSG